jgi:hypothetical protein
VSATTTLSFDKADRWSAENLARYRAKKVNVIPAGPERQGLRFDQRIVRPRFPVQADFDGEGFTSTGLAYEDYARMSTQHHKQSGERRLSTPDWAFNDSLLRSLLVRYLENRAGLRRHQPGNEKERLERAVQKLNADADGLKAVLQRMCAEYVVLRNSGADPERLIKLQRLIENYDSTLRVNANPAAITIGIVHRYYRVGLDSVGVASELGIKPPAVRQTLWRLRRVWKQMQEWRGPRIRINVLGDWKPPAKVSVPRARRTRVSKAESSWRGPRIRINLLGDWKPPARVIARRGRKSKIDVTLAARMRDENKTYKDIAAFFGVQNSATVIDALKKAGLWKPCHKIDVTIAVQMRDAGKTYADIGAFFGAHGSSVYVALRNAGLLKPRVPKPKPPKVPRVRKSKIDVNLAVQMRDAGKTREEIAELFGVTGSAIGFALKKAGLWKPHSQLPKIFRSKVDKDIAVQMFAAGKTYKEMGSFFGVFPQTVEAAVRKYGIWKPRPRRRPARQIDMDMLARLFNEGKTHGELQQALNVPRWTVRNRLEQLGLWRGKGRGRRRSKIDRELAARMFAEGKTYRAIADFFGVKGTESVAYALRKHGVWKPRCRNRRAS